MSRVPYRALMRPQRTPPVPRPGFSPEPLVPLLPPEPALVVEQPVVELVEVAPEPAPVPPPPLGVTIGDPTTVAGRA